ncbi:hypothetical protein AB834_01465 [PVC group bacterium (ex Bugula neritina AB1)]|nr:hypothetical protein AB834_01465 [PVC group bacterium (ex Bugula neritina AB1)]
MESLLTHIFLYIASAVAIAIAGVFLVRSGESLATKWGLDHAWLGSVLIAAATSFPELATSIRVASLGSYDMLISNICGSICFNIFLLSLVCFIFYKKIVVDFDRSVTKASFLIAGMLSLVILSPYFPVKKTFLSLGFETWLILGLYFFYMFLSFKKNKNECEQKREEISKKYFYKDILIYLFCVLVIFIASHYCVKAAEVFVSIAGLGNNFVGLVFLALATSLPEGVTVFEAVRLKSMKLVWGIILGSNIFNMCVISLSDFFVSDKSFIKNLSLQNQFISILTLLYVLLVPYVFSKCSKKYSFDLKKSSLLVIVGYFLILLFSFNFS